MPRKAKRNVVPLEKQEQIQLADWLRKKGIRFTASSNGGKRSLLEALSFKRMGVSPGFPDVTIPYASGRYHGLYIELKRISNSKVSDEQLDWISFLREQGYFCEIAYGFDHARQVVLDYFALTPLAA